MTAEGLESEYMAKNDNTYDPSDAVSFSLLDDSTVYKLHKKISVLKDERWNAKQMTSKVLHGILNGESIPKIANSMAEVVGNNMASAVRNARTMVTGAENEGRQDSFENLEKQGVVQKKVWMATPDDRTRASHIEIDGEEVDVNEHFSNGCMYPADPEGAPEEVWNCRCTMVTHIVGFKKADGSIAKIQYGRDRTMHDDQMDAERDRRGVEKKEPTQQTKEPEKVVLHGDIDEYNRVKDYVESNGVAHRPVEDLDHPLTDEEIIAKLAGGDMTGGSCVSLALSYCGNVVGLDVTDYRGGVSQKAFSRFCWRHSMQTAGATVVDQYVQKEARDVAKMLKGLEMDKKYMLICGQHASIVRRTADGLQYLELQSAKANGWKPFEYTRQVPSWSIDPTTGRYVTKTKESKVTVADTLYSRFGCRKTVGGWYHIAEVDSFKKTEEFKDILGYINTASDQQKKGVSGSEK
jgi:hypothetical protein